MFNVSETNTILINPFSHVLVEFENSLKLNECWDQVHLGGCVTIIGAASEWLAVTKSGVLIIQAYSIPDSIPIAPGTVVKHIGFETKIAFTSDLDVVQSVEVNRVFDPTFMGFQFRVKVMGEYYKLFPFKYSQTPFIPVELMKDIFTK